MLTHWRILTAQFRYIYAYAWREWNEAARELGRLVSPHRCLRTLGTHRQGERQSELWGWSSICTERRVGNGVQFTGCQYTYVHPNFDLTRSTFVSLAHRVSGIFFHLALHLLKTITLYQPHYGLSMFLALCWIYLGYIMQDTLLKEFTVSLEIPVLCNGIKGKTKQGGT